MLIELSTTIRSFHFSRCENHTNARIHQNRNGRELKAATISHIYIHTHKHTNNDTTTNPQMMAFIAKEMLGQKQNENEVYIHAELYNT